MYGLGWRGERAGYCGCSCCSGEHSYLPKEETLSRLESYRRDLEEETAEVDQRIENLKKE